MRKQYFPNRGFWLIAIFNLTFLSFTFSKGENFILLNDGTKITVCDNVTYGGLIQGSETGCPDPEFDPSIIVNVALPTGGSGDLEYLWIYTTGDPNAPVTTWLPIPNSNIPDYDPGPITVETHYMRCARRFECADYTGESNYVTKSIECCDNVTDGGTIDSDQIICDLSFDPDPITNSIAPNGGSGNIEYQWYLNITGSPFDINNPDWSIIPGATSDSFDPDVLSITTYYVRVARRAGCDDYVGESNLVTITVSEGPKIDTAFLTPTTCFGTSDGSINLLISSSIGFVTFEWSDNLFPTPIQNNLSAGTYCVTISDTNECSTEGCFEILQPEEIVLNTGFDYENCDPIPGATAHVTVVSGGQGNVDFHWNDNNNSTTDTIKGIPAGIYTVVAMDEMNCSVSQDLEVLMTNPISLDIIETPATCADSNDGQLLATASGGSGTYTYVWSDPNRTRGATLSGISEGNFFLTVTDTDSCELVGNASLQAPGEININIQTTDGGCNSDLGSATAIASGGVGNLTYLWSDMQGNQTAINLPAGGYEVTVTDQNGCVASSSATIQNNSAYSISTFKEDMNCMAGSSGSAWVVATGGIAPYNYTWSNTIQNDSITDLNSGIYYVTVIDDAGCTRIDSILIENISPIDAQIFKTDNNCLGDQTASIWVNVSSGLPPFNFSWSNMASTDTISNLPDGLYTVTITDQNGCEEVLSQEIQTLSALTGTISHTDILCHGRSNGSAEFATSGGVGVVNYLWSNSGSLTNIQNLQPGTYSVVATDELGCEANGSATITEPADLVCDVTINSTVTTYNGTEGSLSGTASGGTGTLNYSWSTNSNNQQIDNLSAGLYALTVTDENGCLCTNMVSLDNPSKIDGYTWVDDNGNGIQDLGENGIANVTVTLTGTDINGQAVNLPTQTNSAGNYTFDGLMAGDYKLTFSKPVNYGFTNQDIGANDNTDSDADRVTGMTSSFTLAVSSTESFDAGFIRENISIDIGDYVWFDTNRDGVQGSIESGVPNFKVYLRNASGGSISQTATTNLSGKYIFNNVQPGSYYIEFDSFSLLAGYIFTAQDIGNDNRDSDADSNGKTAVFSIVANQNDDLSFDAGVHALCDNVTSGGTIGTDELLCGSGADPSEITSLTSPSGGVGTIEYLWLSSNTPVYTGPGDPNWIPIPNSNSSSYDPDPIFSTTYFIRCARREGCTDFPGESNTVKKEIMPLPSTEIDSPPSVVCNLDPTNFTAVSLGGGTDYEWSFEGGASPSSAGGRVVNGVTWSTSGTKTVVLTATRLGCSSNDTAFVKVLLCPKPLGKFENINLETVGNVFTKISWNTETKDENTYFDIEKSFDKVNFKKIKIIVGNSNLNRSDYIYSDYEIEEGMVYYRIKHYTSNEIAIHSETVEIENIFNKISNSIKIYPNPSTGILVLESGVAELVSGKFNIYDSYGSLVLGKNIEISSGKNQILVSELPNGVYIIQSQNNPSIVSKFVIHH